MPTARRQSRWVAISGIGTRTLSNAATVLTISADVPAVNCSLRGTRILTTDGGMPIEDLKIGVRHVPYASDGWSHRFRIDAAARRLILSSLTDVPMRAIPGNLDGRWLGMAIYAVRIISSGARPEVASDWLGFGEGFHPHEGRHRWINGSATIPAAMLAPFRAEVMIEIDGHGLGAYRAGRTSQPVTVQCLIRA